VAVVVDDEEGMERDRVLAPVQVLDLDDVAGLDLVLLAARLDDRVHRPSFSAAPGRRRHSTS
jgi:hypothetical protein